MQRQRSWPSVLFHFEQRTLQRTQRILRAGFHVGIWWHDDERIVTFLQSISEIETTGHLIDSDFSHDSAWEIARRELTCRKNTEYVDVPRGRILWDIVHQSGLMYHGNSTPAEVFDQLARLYRLPRWQARLDEHYLTGEALEDFYRLD